MYNAFERDPFIQKSRGRATHVMKVLADAARAASLIRLLMNSKRLLQKALAGYECLLQRLLIGLYCLLISLHRLLIGNQCRLNRLLVGNKRLNHAIQSRGTIGIRSWARRL